MITKRKIKILIIILLISCIVAISYSYLKTYLNNKEREAINQEIMLMWFGDDEYSFGLKTEDAKSNEINPLYIKTMERWEKEGLLTILEETGVWTEKGCRDADIFDEDTLEYRILHGGISFEEIDYVQFNEAMIKIGSAHGMGTNDSCGMLIYWRKAAMIEADNTCD